MSIAKTIKQLEQQLAAAKAVAKNNQKFRTLSKAEKRVAIAKDVIEQVKAKRYIAEQGTYCYVDEDDRDRDAQEYLATGGECRVCALGGLFTSAVKVKNRVTVADMEDSEQRDMHTYLRGIFDKKQLVLIECAFERGAAFYLDAFENECHIDPEGGVKYPAIVDAAVRFGGRYAADDKRMIAIMQNIIKNNGTFNPESK